MIKNGDRTTANLEVVLEEACRHLRDGGDHETRKHIAKKKRIQAGPISVGVGITGICRDRGSR